MQNQIKIPELRQKRLQAFLSFFVFEAGQLVFPEKIYLVCPAFVFSEKERGGECIIKTILCYHQR
jgi:hypothetical protein